MVIADVIIDDVCFYFILHMINCNVLYDSNKRTVVIPFFLLMFACVKDLMMAVLMGISHPFNSIEEIALARILLICPSGLIVELGKIVFLACWKCKGDFVGEGEEGGGIMGERCISVLLYILFSLLI